MRYLLTLVIGEGMVLAVLIAAVILVRRYYEQALLRMRYRHDDAMRGRNQELEIWHRYYTGQIGDLTKKLAAFGPKPKDPATGLYLPTTPGRVQRPKRPRLRTASNGTTASAASDTPTAE